MLYYHQIIKSPLPSNKRRRMEKKNPYHDKIFRFMLDDHLTNQSIV